MENNEDDARHDLRNIRDEIHDMLAALERSKVSEFESEMRMESRQMQQWIVERSDLERQLREEWSANTSEAQRLLLQQQRQIELASQRTSSKGLHELRTSRRHIRKSKELTSSQEAKESSIDDVDLISDSTIPPPTLTKKRNRTHRLVHRPHSMEFDQAHISSDASSEYRDPEKPENLMGPGKMAADYGSEGVPPATNRRRDYVSGHLGFYTFLSDGFGTDSLAYCHDMVHYPGHEDKSWGSSLLRYTLDGIDHAHVQWVTLSKVSWNGKPLQKKLHAHWSPLADRIRRMIGKKSKDETLDWVFAEHQAQAQ
ncbi:hypothetical protein BGZ82_007854 [Podila clonocystis]|nr:hypothetical protein BGZ82_007854 [Podila clonocystis]